MSAPILLPGVMSAFTSHVKIDPVVTSEVGVSNRMYDG